MFNPYTALLVVVIRLEPEWRGMSLSSVEDSEFQAGEHEARGRLAAWLIGPWMLAVLPGLAIYGVVVTVAGGMAAPLWVDVGGALIVFGPVICGGVAYIRPWWLGRRGSDIGEFRTWRLATDERLTRFESVLSLLIALPVAFVIAELWRR